MIKIHPSSLGDIMTMAKGKNKEPEVLSVGAMTHCYFKAKEFVYGYKPDIKSKYLDKGIMCEDDSIALYNSVFFTSHKKNTQRLSNGYLTGECDIYDSEQITDIKTAWSLQTFPVLSERIDSKLYDWQGRAYMDLWGVKKFRVAYCMVDTPESLVRYEDDSLHLVSHIDPSLRVTIKDFDYCEEKSKLIKIKCQAAQIQIQKYIEEISLEHSEL